MERTEEEMEIERKRERQTELKKRQNWVNREKDKEIVLKKLHKIDEEKDRGRQRNYKIVIQSAFWRQD